MLPKLSLSQAMKVVMQLSITLPNTPGALAKMSDVLRAADVNIEALFCSRENGNTAVHVVVDDPETAKMVLRDINEVSMLEVLAIPIKNKPGAIAQIARSCAGHQINIEHIYATSFGKDAMVYLDVDDLEKAKKVLK
jgi:hypothetical protein